MVSKTQQTDDVQVLFTADLKYSEPKKHSWLYRGEGAIKSLYVDREESGFGNTPPASIKLIAMPGE